MDTLPPLGQKPNPEALEEYLHDYPGGEHILPYYQQGPYWIALISELDDPSWGVKAALEAYPALVHLASPDNTLSVHALPAFGKRLLEWDWTDQQVMFDDPIGPFEQPPTPNNIARSALPAMLGHYGGAVADACAAAEQAVGLDGLLKLVAALPRPVVSSEADLTAAIRGALT